MKTILLSTLAAITVVAPNVPAWADDPPPVPPPPPDAIVPGPPELPAPPALPVPPGLPNLNPMLSELHRHLQSQLSHVGSAVQDLVAAALPGGFGGGEVFTRQTEPGRPGRTLVIPGKDPKGAANAEEDLNVMARILEKALVSREEDKDERRAMGIAISMLGPGSGAPRNLYLDGYGAVFFLDVNFPLLPPPKKDDDVKSKEPVSSEWEEARRELESAQSPEQRLHSVIKGPRGGLPYDAERVDQLKDSILESLKNATHIRDLKPDESITIVVTGGNARTEGGKLKLIAPKVTRRTESRAGEGGVVETRTLLNDASRVPGPHGETTMTIRVKKSDADAFAKGKLEMDDFRKRATIRVY